MSWINTIVDRIKQAIAPNMPASCLMLPFKPLEPIGICRLTENGPVKIGIRYPNESKTKRLWWFPFFCYHYLQFDEAVANSPYHVAYSLPELVEDQTRRRIPPSEVMDLIIDILKAKSASDKLFAPVDNTRINTVLSLPV